jgi:lysosome membrane protein 2
MAKIFILITLWCLANGKELNLQDNDEFIVDVYLKSPVKPVMKFFFFNLTNPEEFLTGGTPIFNEVGPFAYKAKLVKEDVKWVNDGLIEFVPKVMYRYYPKKPKGNRQFDKITTINMPLFSALNSMKNTNDDRAQKTIASFVEILGQKPYVTHTVRDLLWGYDNQLLNLAKTINDAQVFPEDKLYPYDQFGFFVGKNVTNVGTMRVASGLDSTGHLAEVKEWKEPKESAFDDNIGIWEEGSQCDKARGSDGFVFPKNVQKNSKQQVINRNFCRSLSFTYQEDITDKNGIDGYR